MGKKEVYLKILVNYLIAAAILAFVVFAVPKLIGFFWPFVVAWIIAMIANPFVRFLEKKVKIVRKHSSAIIIVLVLVIVTGVLYVAVAVAVRELASFMEGLPQLYQTFEREIYAFRDRINEENILPEFVRGYLDNIIENVGGVIGDSIWNLKTYVTIRSAGNLVKNMVEGIVMGIITILSSYFIIAERDNVASWFANKTPEGFKGSYRLVVGNFQSAVGGYIKAQVKISVVIFSILFIGLLLLRVEFAFLVAFLIAFLDFLPIFGAGAVLWPWALYDVITGNYVRAILLMVIYVVCLVVRQLIQPKMVADSIGLSPFATLFFMFVGYRIAKILGMIIGIPIGMVIMNFYRVGMFDGLIKGLQVIVHDIDEFRKF